MDACRAGRTGREGCVKRGVGSVTSVCVCVCVFVCMCECAYVFLCLCVCVSLPSSVPEQEAQSSDSEGHKRPTPPHTTTHTHIHRHCRHDSPWQRMLPPDDHCESLREQQQSVRQSVWGGGEVAVSECSSTVAVLAKGLMEIYVLLLNDRVTPTQTPTHAHTVTRMHPGTPALHTNPYSHTQNPHT